jgi:ribosomal-protein-alanine N-acetyltransferase
MIVAETERLILREMKPLDAASVYELNSDPEVIKYTGDRSFRDLAEAQEFLAKYDHYKKYGFGRWAVLDKTTGGFLGWCGLKYTPEAGEHDIGFRFFKKEWNKGYATESARKCLDLGFSRFDLKWIVGRAQSENTASIHVLKKIGLTFWKNGACGERDGVIYRIEK